MKKMTCQWLLAAALFVGTAGGIQAQSPGGAGSGLNAAMMKLFADVSGFTATAEMKIEQDGKEMMTAKISSSFAAGKMRTDMDMGQLKSAQMPPQATAMMKQMGLDKITTVAVTDKKVMNIIYPNMQGYLEMPMPPDEAKAAAAKFKIETKELGKETVAGHACTKNLITMTSDDGQKFQATTWNAKDMKDFPIRIQMADKGLTVDTTYSDVKLTAPDAKVFEVPAGYKKFTSQQELMMAGQQKLMGNGIPPTK